MRLFCLSNPVLSLSVLIVLIRTQIPVFWDSLLPLLLLLLCKNPGKMAFEEKAPGKKTQEEIFQRKVVRADKISEKNQGGNFQVKSCSGEASSEKYQRVEPPEKYRSVKAPGKKCLRRKNLREKIRGANVPERKCPGGKTPGKTFRGKLQGEFPPEEK